MVPYRHQNKKAFIVDRISPYRHTLYACDNTFELLTQTLARSGSTKTGPFHDLRQRLAQIGLFTTANRNPLTGGVIGGPAKHCARAIHLLAPSPVTTRLVSAMLRTCITTCAKAVASPLTQLLESVSFHSQIFPDGDVSRTKGNCSGTGNLRLINVQLKIATPR